MLKEAYLYEKYDDERVRCLECRHYCIIKRDRYGVCGVKKNIDNKLYSLVYGKPIAINLDPIEKKPLFHFLPGSSALSYATVGCNFKCLFCQNWDISQMPRDRHHRIEGYDVSAEEMVQLALKYRAEVIAHTYTEPSIFFEYAYDIAKISSQYGIKNIFVTNGYISPQALEMIRPYLHAVNIDLKGWSEEYYRKIIGARLSEVLDSIKLHKKSGIWVELTTLIVPGWNDTEEQIREIARFIRDEVGPETPWHISRFHPAYKMRDYPPTPIETLKMAYRIGKEEGLRFVYLGNVPGDESENTYCPKCGRLLIKRWGFEVLENHIKDGKCPYCGEKIEGVWNQEES